MQYEEGAVRRSKATTLPALSYMQRCSALMRRSAVFFIIQRNMMCKDCERLPHAGHSKMVVFAQTAEDPHLTKGIAVGTAASSSPFRSSFFT